MALPGLVDSHVHALSAGLSEYRESLPPLDSFQAIVDYIHKRAKKTPKGQWIVVPRTFPTRLEEMRMPTKEVVKLCRFVCSTTPLRASIKIMARSHVEAPVAMLRVYCSWPGVSAMMNFRLDVEKYG